MSANLKLLIAIFAAVAISACSGQSTKTGSSSTDDASGSDASTVVVDENAGSVFDSGNVDPEAGLDNVFYFDFDKSTLTFASRTALDAYAAVLKENPRSIRLEGHADERGTREYNIALGERRANAVADYLISSGVPASQIASISYGEERPAVAGSSDSALSKNRRVELK